MDHIRAAVLLSTPSQIALQDTVRHNTPLGTDHIIWATTYGDILENVVIDNGSGGATGARGGHNCCGVSARERYSVVAAPAGGGQYHGGQLRANMW